MKPGKYLIIKHAFWTLERADFIIITEYNSDENEVYYYYPVDATRRVRSRFVGDFNEGTFVPASSLIELLV